MKSGVTIKPRGTHRLPSTLKSLRLLALLLASFAVPLSPAAQPRPVPLSPWWMVSVDEATQQIFIQWAPCPDSATMGYHICTGRPCVDYDTIFGRLDTTYRCLDHSPLERHTYRLHVFDTARSASPLTPYFCNMVLSADMKPCASSATLSWSPYEGMPAGLDKYQLLARFIPLQDDYSVVYTTDSAGPLRHTIDIPESATQAVFKVQAIGRIGGNVTQRLVSESNRLDLRRQTADTARFLEILSVCYDSIFMRNIITVRYDTAFHASPYTVWHSVNGDPWHMVTSLFSPDTVCVDPGINPHDSLHCYRISVHDACGLNDKYSDTLCRLIPEPPQPAVAIPNVIKVGDSVNGLFCPRVRGLMGTVYELTIFNRLGLQIFHTTDPTACWDPMAHDPDISQGSYAYRLRCQFNDTMIKTYTGTVLVLR